MFVDSHCHLEFDALYNDHEGVMSRAHQAGVGVVVTIGISKPEFAKSIGLAERSPDVYCCLGVHPHDAAREEQSITTEELVAIASHPKVIGIGETGLDYFYMHSPKEAQQEVFRKHIRAAIETGLPLIIHTRDAEDDTIRILREERKGNEDRLKGVLHCFSSNREMAEFGLEIGFYISLSGMITFNKSENIREIAKDVPMDRLLIETDSPFLAPVPLRGKPCEPAYIVHTAKCLAEIKNVSVDEVERLTTDNFFNLFKKVARP